MACRISPRLFISFTKSNVCKRLQASRSLSSDSFKDEPVSTNSEAEAQQVKDEDTMYEAEIKLKVLDASLDFVMDQGWTKDSLASGAERLGYPGIVHGMFPKGGVELVYHFYNQSNLQLSEELKSKHGETEGLHQTSDKASEEIMRGAIETRLRMNVPYVLTGRWTEALGLMALPQNAPDSLRHLALLVDDIWHYAGDKSSDFSWYTKRAALAGVYKFTELYMLQDKSIDFQDTWKFLDRRLAQMQDLRQCEQRVVNFATHGSSVLGGLFQTVLNMANMNSTRR